MPAPMRSTGRSAEEIRSVIEAFLKQCKEPALLEPGEDLFGVGAENFTLDLRGPRLTLQAWDRTRNLTRRVVAIESESPGRLQITVQRFANRVGQMYLIDLARPAGADLGKRSGRLIFRERFRLLLRRQFPEWQLAELSADPNLEYSLSPSFPRAFLRHGQHGWAAIACPPEADAGAVLSFGLIWLTHLRARERRMALEGLAIFVPEGSERATALRLPCLNPAAARFALFAYTPQDAILSVDPLDHGNLDTRLEVCRQAQPNRVKAWQRIAELPGVESVAKHDGRVSLRVHGIEFAELDGADLRFGLHEKRTAGEHHVSEIIGLAEALGRARSPDAKSHGHALYRQYPEAWLESQVRANLETIDASLNREPLYGQVPAFAGGDRGILDLLAVDYSGRLAVVELKASADLHLPLQALDYWVRVKWHLGRGEFAANGYFPNVALRAEDPRLVLVSPCLEFHPTTETILDYFAPHIEVERVGVAVEWRKGLEIMFRLSGAQRPR